MGSATPASRSHSAARNAWRTVVSFSAFSLTKAIASSRSIGPPQLVRNAGQDDTGLEQQLALDEQRAVVVQKPVPPPRDEELRDHHGRDRSGIGGDPTDPVEPPGAKGPGRGVHHPPPPPLPPPCAN